MKRPEDYIWWLKCDIKEDGIWIERTYFSETRKNYLRREEALKLLHGEHIRNIRAVLEPNSD